MAHNAPSVKPGISNAYELQPIYDSRNSFYRKALVIVDENCTAYLRSYDTIVCAITRASEVVKLWDGYSVTTMRHINEFMRQNGLTCGGKAWWDSLEYSKEV